MNTTLIDSEPCALRAWAEGQMIFPEPADGSIIGFLGDRVRYRGSIFAVRQNCLLNCEL